MRPVHHPRHRQQRIYYKRKQLNPKPKPHHKQRISFTTKKPRKSSLLFGYLNQLLLTRKAKTKAKNNFTHCTTTFEQYYAIRNGDGANAVNVAPNRFDQYPESKQQSKGQLANNKKSLNLRYFTLVLATLVFLICLFCAIKLLACLTFLQCGLRLDPQYLIALLLLFLLLLAYLTYQIMLLLASFWEKFNINLLNKGQQSSSMSASSSIGSRLSSSSSSTTPIPFNVQSIALVSNYFQVEKRPPSASTTSSTPIPSINLQLLDDRKSSIVKEYSPTRTQLKKLSICSIEIASEFLSKYAPTDEWFGRNSSNSRLSMHSASSESVSTERSDYYLELPSSASDRDPPRSYSASPTPTPGSPILLTKSASFKHFQLPKHNGTNLSRNLSVCY